MHQRLLWFAKAPNLALPQPVCIWCLWGEMDTKVAGRELGKNCERSVAKSVLYVKVHHNNCMQITYQVAEPDIALRTTSQRLNTVPVLPKHF